MTTDLITFFQPKESKGIARTFPSRSDNNPVIETWAFVAGLSDPPRFSTSAVAAEEEGKSLVRDLQDLIQQHGGIFVQAREHNEVVKTQINQVKNGKYTPPQSMLRLSVAGDPCFEKITGSTDLEMGDHLVIPVSAEAEERLRAFCKELKGLPTDMAASILNLIRRPSLEWRIDRIERTLSLPPANWAEQQRGRARRGDFLDKLHDAVMWKIPIGPAIAALLVLFITVVAYYEYFAQEGQAVAAEETDEYTEPEISVSPAQNVVDPPEDVQRKDSTSQSLQASLNALYRALQVSKNTDLKKLYEKHFNGQTNNSATMGWGMAKLQALQLGLIPPNDKILDLSDNPTAVSTLYQKTALSAIKRNKGSLSLLAWSCCQSFGGAVLPKTASKPALPLGEDLKCNELEHEALSGLTALTDWVEQQK